MRERELAMTRIQHLSASLIDQCRLRMAMDRWSFAESADCVPGCYRPPLAHELANNASRRVRWCRSNRTSTSDAYCPWPPSALDRMLEQCERQNHARKKHDRWATSCNFAGGCKYNEVLLSAQRWVRDLPATIEAFVVPLGGPLAVARAARQRFGRLYGLAPPPLVEYSYLERRSDAPFRLVT